MRHLLVCAALLSFTVMTHAQQNTGQAPIYQKNYAEKSKKQKKAGRILLWVGGGLILTGILIPEGELIEEGFPRGGTIFADKHKNDGIRAAFMVAGVVSAVASIPFFIASKKNGRRAASLAFDIKKIQKPASRSMVFTSIPALSVKVNL